MQTVKFDSAEVEYAFEKLCEYSYAVNKAVSELDAALQSLAFDTQKVIDNLCYSSPVRTADDGARGKIDYVLTRAPLCIDRLNAMRSQAQTNYIVRRDVAGYWSKLAEGQRSEIEVFDEQIRAKNETIRLLPSDAEAERERLQDEINHIRECEIEPRRSSESFYAEKAAAENRGANAAIKEVNAFDGYIKRCRKIIAAAEADNRRLKKTLASLAQIKEKLSGYRAKLHAFSAAVNAVIKKSRTILGKAIAAITKLKNLSRANIPDFENKPMRVKYDLDECGKYKNIGDEFAAVLPPMTQKLAKAIADLPEWDDFNRAQASETVLSHKKVIDSVAEFFDVEMEFLKKQIIILTDYYNSIN